MSAPKETWLDLFGFNEQMGFTTATFEKDCAGRWHERYLLASDVEAEVASLRAQLAEARAAQEWRPIETAPKDGTVVLGFDPTRDVLGPDDDQLGGVDFMRWMEAVDDSDEGWYDPTTHPMNPTLWQPIPARPIP